jgi:putative SOS response-associated peptidase YedK
VPAVRVSRDDAGRELALLRWGLIPGWADGPSIGNRMINARADTVATKPAFRKAFRQRRCLIVADGFYEWKKLNGRKQPYYIRLQDDQLFAFAGLWERWNRGDSPIDSCTILTTDANEVVGSIHDRMPVILEPWDHGLRLPTPAYRLLSWNPHQRICFRLVQALRCRGRRPRGQRPDAPIPSGTKRDSAGRTVTHAKAKSRASSIARLRAGQTNHADTRTCPTAARQARSSLV